MSIALPSLYRLCAGLAVLHDGDVFCIQQQVSEVADHSTSDVI